MTPKPQKTSLRFLAFMCVAALFGCAQANPKAAPHNDEPFISWLGNFKKDARAQGISNDLLTQAFKNVSPNETVIRLDRKQPESKLTLDEYLEKVINDARIAKGRALLAEHRTLLEEIGSKYSVQPQIIVALWGIETSYGSNTGGYGIFEALATLAYDGRRSEYFRKELINALKIAQADHIDAADMRGSWAGAMGQCQFMPSSFLRYAVDYNKDGKRDIWNSLPDVFASIAHYLASEGWDKSAGWQEGERNFSVLMRWNRSRYFVTAVGTLANQIAEDNT